MKKTLVILMVLAVAFAAFANAATETKSASKEFEGLTYKATIALATNPIGQSSYQQGANLQDMFAKVGSNLTVISEATNGYAENPGLIYHDEAEIGFTNNLMLSDAYNAKGDYANFEKGKIAGIMSLSRNKTHVIVLKNSGITEVSYEQFKGKRIGIGQVGGTSRYDALALMDALGLKPGDYISADVKGAEQTEMMKNGQLDIFIWNGKAPIATVLDLIASKDCVFLDIPDDIVDKIIKNSDGAYTKQVLEAEYYGLDRDIKTYGNNPVFFCREDLEEEIVYEFVKQILENLDSLIEVNKGFKDIGLDHITEGISIPLHPGAERYYREIGVIK